MRPGTRQLETANHDRYRYHDHGVKGPARGRQKKRGRRGFKGLEGGHTTSTHDDIAAVVVKVFLTDPRRQN